jgi:hypothetical protein
MSTISVTDTNDLAWDALVVSLIVDAASLEPRVVTAATVDLPHASAFIATGSYLVVSGRPDLAMPNLATTAYSVPVELEFPDRAPLDVTFTVPAGQVLPYETPAGTPVELPAVTLTGTVTEAAYPYTPIPGASVALTAPSPPPAFAAVTTPVALARAAGTGVTGVTTAAAAPATALQEAITLGDSAVTVLDSTGFAAGGAVALGSPTDAEHGLVTAVDAATDVVTLAAPVRRSRPAAAAAQALSYATPGPATTLARDVEAGDGVLELTAELTTPLARLDGASPELRGLGAITDPNGRWRIDGVRAIGTVALTISAAGYTTAGPTNQDIDYGGGPNWIVDRLA